MDNLLNEIKNIALKYKNISKVILFGSRARKDNTAKSDYDLAVFSDMSIEEKSQFSDDIDNIATLNKFDIVFIKEKNINTELYCNILMDGVVIMDKFQIKLNNYKNALTRLHEAIDESMTTDSLTVRDGVIQRFEFTAELAWKTIREYLLSEMITDINTPKSVMREAYNNDIVVDDKGWLQILDDRSKTSHVYDESDANNIYNNIISSHIILFDKLLNTLSKKL